MKLILFPLYSWENWDWEELSNLPSVAAGVGAEIQIPVCLQSLMKGLSASMPDCFPLGIPQ